MPDQNIVVVGLGPVGLAAALEAAKADSQKNHIIAINDRSAYTRNRFLIIRDELLDYLQDLAGLKAVEAFKKEHVSMSQTSIGRVLITQISALENLLFEQVKQCENVEVIFAPKQNYSETIDLETNTLTLVTKDDSLTIPFKYLISADGSHHSLENQIPTFEYTDHHTNQLSRNHIAAQFEIPEGSENTYTEYLAKEPLGDYLMVSQLKSFGWQHASAPDAIIIIKDHILYLLAESTANLTHVESERWSSILLSQYFPEEIIGGLKLKFCSPFTTPLEESDLYVVSSKNKDNQFSYFFSIGDAMHLQHYRTGTGAQLGFEQAKALGGFFKSLQSEKDLYSYRMQIDAIRQKGCQDIDNLLRERKRHEMEACYLNKLIEKSLAFTKEAKKLLREESAKMCDTITFLPTNEIYLEALEVLSQFKQDVIKTTSDVALQTLLFKNHLKFKSFSQRSPGVEKVSLLFLDFYRANDSVYQRECSVAATL